MAFPKPYWKMMVPRTFIPAVMALIGFSVLFFLPGGKIGRHLPFDQFDKLVHFGLFFLLQFLFSAPFLQEQPNKHHRVETILILIALVICLYGFLVEWIQKKYIPNRSFDFKDILADALGVAVSLMVCLKIQALFNKARFYEHPSR